MGLHTIFPYLILICFVKNIACIHADFTYIKSKKWSYCYPVSLVITILIFAVFRYEGVIFIDNLQSFVFVFVAAFVLYWNILLRLFHFHNQHLFIWLGAVLFGLFSSIGNQAIYDKNGMVGIVVSCFCWSFLFDVALECLYEMFEYCSCYAEPQKDYLKWGIITFVLSCVVDSIFLLVYYPGVMTHDSFTQMCQVTGGIPYSNHHPWLHTMSIKGIYDLGNILFHSTNKAFALYGLCSIAILSFSFSCSVMYLRKRGLKSPLVILVMLAYIVSPINQMYSITMWKDIPFAAFVLLFIVLLSYMCERQGHGMHNRYQWLLFVPLSFAVCFFRTNGLYVFLGMIPFVIWTFWREKRYAIGAIGIVLLLGCLYKGPIFNYFKVVEPDPIEALSIPAQQIGAVFLYDGNITEEQRELLANIVDTESLGKAYKLSPTCSDAVKNLVRETDNQAYITAHKGDFFGLYTDLFMKNKRIFVKAFIDETYGYWYHNVTFANAPWSTYIESNGMGINRESKMPSSVQAIFSKYLEKSRFFYDKYCSVGLFVYIFFALFVIAWQRKSRHILSFIPILGVWCTLLIATPVYADLRYAYALYIALPFLAALTTIPDEEGGE